MATPFEKASYSWQRIGIDGDQDKIADDTPPSRAQSHRIDDAFVRNHDGSTLVKIDMPTTLTLKNIPDAVYERLKRSAQEHRRSMNSEAIVCLETALLSARVAPAERLARARELSAALPKGKFRARDIDALKRDGRPFAR